MSFARRAFTTVELMVVLAIGGLIAGGVVSVLRRQQRFFTNTASLIEQRVALRDATGILPGELRALAPGEGDVLAFSDSALEMRATIGAAIACDTLPNGAGLALAPDRLGARPPLASFATTPQSGDLIGSYAPAEAATVSTDRWTWREISAVSSSTTVCGASPLVDIASASTPRLQVRFATAGVAADVLAPGAFVRILRRIRYRFYRAGTGDWYLGYSEWDGATFGTVQPVSGPFASYARGGVGGLTLRYFDEPGTELMSGDDPTRIARVDVRVRGSARARLSGLGGAVSDSQAIGIRMRNR